MAVSKKKNIQRDFFVLDIADVVPKDDMLSMEYPIFSLATKPDMRIRKYENDGKTLEIIPSGIGLATIHDKDALIWGMSKIIHAKNQGLPYSRTVRGSAHDLLSATNRGVSSRDYERLKHAFTRLRGTTFVSDIFKDNDKRAGSVFGIVDNADFIYDTKKNRLDEIEITFSKWLFDEIDNFKIVSISETYFQLRRPLERRLYEIGKKHCGKSKKWEIGLARLQAKTGSNAPLKRFRHNLRQIISEDDTPDYKMELTEQDKVIYRPRKTSQKITDDILLPSWAEEKGREIAIEKGWDYRALLGQWKAFAKSNEPPQNAGAAFIGFCNKKEKLR